MKTVTPKEAHSLQAEGWAYLDVRSVPEFENGHPAGAFNIPLMHAGGAGMVPNPEFLKVVQAVFPPTSKLVVGCLAGGRSMRAVQMLSQAGYSNIVDQCGGWGGGRDAHGQDVAGWAAEKLPSEQGAPADRSWNDLQKRVNR